MTETNPEKQRNARQVLRAAIGILLMLIGLAGQVAIGLSFESMQPPGFAWRVFGLMNFAAIELGGFAMFYFAIRRRSSD